MNYVDGGSTRDKEFREMAQKYILMRDPEETLALRSNLIVFQCLLKVFFSERTTLFPLQMCPKDVLQKQRKDFQCNSKYNIWITPSDESFKWR